MERMWSMTVVAQFRSLFQHLSAGSEDRVANLSLYYIAAFEDVRKTEISYSLHWDWQQIFSNETRQSNSKYVKRQSNSKYAKRQSNSKYVKHKHLAPTLKTLWAIFGIPIYHDTLICRLDTVYYECRTGFRPELQFVGDDNYISVQTQGRRLAH